MGQDSLSKYFLKGKQNQDDQPQVDLGMVLGRGGCVVPNTELSGPLEQRTRISQEKLGDSSSCSVCRDQNTEFEQHGKALLSSAPGGVQAHFPVVTLISHFGGS